MTRNAERSSRSDRLDPDLEAALKRRYGDRPERLAEVLANAHAWLRLKAVVSTEGVRA